MRAQEPHRLAGRGAHRRQAEPPDQAVEDGVRRLARLDDAGGDAERPGRGRDQERVRLHVVRTTSRRSASLSSISRSAVAASGTRSSASASTIRARPSLVDKRIGVQEILDAAEPAGAARGWPRSAAWRARRSAPRPRPSARACRQQRGRDLLVGRRIGRAKAGPAVHPRTRGPAYLRWHAVGHGAVPAGMARSILMAARCCHRARNDARAGINRARAVFAIV